MSNTTTEHPAHHGFVPPKLPKPVNPALAKHKELIELSNRILELTKLIHARTQQPQSVKQ